MTEQEPIKQIISNGNLAITSTINPRYLNAINTFAKEEIEDANKSADYWYHNIGANVIPADTKIKEACILNSWKQYQSSTKFILKSVLSG